MNLVKMFEDQKVVRNKIIEIHNLQGKDLLPNLILALQVELGELANEWRGFKHWSTDREPRTKKMLGEYADCLAFTLEIGLCTYKDCETNIQINHEIYGEIELVQYGNVTKQFNKLFYHVGWLDDSIYDHEFSCLEEVAGKYIFVVQLLLGLGEMLGFTEQQIEQAYYEKHAINLLRQENGY